MKCTFTWLFLFLLVLGTGVSNAQTTFSDDFESYTAGEKIAKSTDKWRTWENKPGTGQDASVTDAKAKSGKNSIVITGGTADGGPVDLVLPFTARYSTGSFKYKMSLLIPSGNNAYFNLQGDATLGSSGPIDALFVEGLFEMTSGGRSIVLSTYPVNEWFEVGFEINLTANIWKILINDNCVAAFSNTTNKVASVDFYGLNATTLYYVDDVSYERLTTATPYVLEAGITGFSWPSGSLTGTEDSISVTVKNFGSQVVSSLDLDFKVNGVSNIIKFSGLTLLKGKDLSVRLPNIYKVQEGDNDLKIEIAKINNKTSDEEPCNNSSGLFIKGVTPANHKAVLAEEGTGTWCVWCPRGAVFMDLLSQRYKGKFIPVAVHNGDPMAVTNYNNLITKVPGFTGFPGAVVERSEVVDPSALERPFLNRISVPAIAKLRTGSKYDDASKEVTVDVEAEFLEDVNGNFRMNLIFAEDGVRGTGSGYNQANNYANNAAGPMGGYEKLPNPVPASKMVYDHVGRAILGLTGVDATFTGDYKKGDKKIITFVYRMPEAYKKENMHVIPVLFNDNVYQNASSSTFDESVAAGLITAVKNVLVIDGMSIYPNPTSEMANINITLNTLTNVSISVSDLTGQVVAARDYGKLVGEYTLPISLVGFNPGTYFASVKTEFGVTTQKIVVAK